MARDRSFDIAVTGMSGRFPGSASITELWSAVTSGQVLTTTLDTAGLARAGVPAAELGDPGYVPVRGHLADADRFDHTVFRFSARDAELMDPQHRLMLEAAWAALEDAGRAPLGDGPVTGVYASDSGSGYLRAMLARGPLDPQVLDQAIHGTEPDFIASLIAYKLDLTGPAIGVRTACSSSLVGLHLAIQALLNGDCDQAVVAAAGIDFPQAGYVHVAGGIQSASGACRPFDAGADGVLAGSGVACVVLRRLADALDDGIEPHGVILGSAVNNDGAAKAGYYAPSPSGQQAAIEAALSAADVDAASVGYLETHGTGTKVGDPIEWSAASAAYRDRGAGAGQIAVGALKGNTGHLDAAAGLAALIKALLVVREGTVPPVGGFTRLNPLLETADSPLYVPSGLEPWSGPTPRRAGVSSFGIGGTNVHVLVEQAPEPPPVPRREGDVSRLVLVSAADPDALARGVGALGDHLVKENPDLADVAHTLAAGRAMLSERAAVTGRTSAEVAGRITGGVGLVRGRRPADGPPPTVFVFPGQGVQRPGMARPFAEVLPGFAEPLEQCLAAFAPDLATRVRAALFDPGFPATELEATELAQPALFAVEYAAAQALTALGLTPAALLGHSLGELTAACCAGVFALPAAAAFVAARGWAMQACPPGAMVAVACDEAAATQLLAESGCALELAAVNSADSCVLAGTAAAAAQFRAWLGDRVFSKQLRTSHAFHSALVEPALPSLAAALDGVVPGTPAVPFAANATGELVLPGARADADLFVRQARRPVRFAPAAEAIRTRLPGAVFVEVGPGQALSAMLDAVPLSPSRTARPAEELLTALGTLWTQGLPLDTAQLCAEGGLVHLPSYAFAGPRWLAPEVDGRQPAPEDVPAEQAAPEPPEPAALLAALWAELLGEPDLTDESDFFRLGGDSLLITQLARKVKQELGVQVPLRAMLTGRTLGRQAEIVRALLNPPA
ncbi:type I polyketide synthase [Amycolatopsis vancoresmycina]|nr:type I polyketide synthase [Amycolatopsis vancoresmycina]